MRCPRCGAFIDDGRSVCFMCGADLKMANNGNNNAGFSNVYGNSFSGGNNVQGYSGGNQGFSSGSYFGTYQKVGGNVSNGFTNPSTALNESGKNFAALNDYDKIYNSVRSNDKDVFDLFSEHKVLFSIIGIVLLVAIFTFAGTKYYQSRIKDPKVDPVIGKLYFEMDDSLKPTDVGNTNIKYTKSNSTGSECTVTVALDEIVSDYVDTLFANIMIGLEPARDRTLKVVNPLEIYTSQQGTTTINDNEWHFLNIFYGSTSYELPDTLERRYMTIIHEGYAYNIELNNGNNDIACRDAMDNFSRSLRFIDA